MFSSCDSTDLKYNLVTLPFFIKQRKKLLTHTDIFKIDTILRYQSSWLPVKPVFKPNSVSISRLKRSEKRPEYKYQAIRSYLVSKWTKSEDNSQELYILK